MILRGFFLLKNWQLHGGQTPQLNDPREKRVGRVQASYITWSPGQSVGGCAGTVAWTVYAQWAFQGNRSRATIMGWEVEFGRQITQIHRNPAFVHAVARRIP